MRRQTTTAAERWSTDELLAQCRNGENTGWQEFLRRYARLIYSTVIKAGLSGDDQDDAFQASIVAIYRGLPRLRDRERLVPWIVAISWRQAINCIRRRARRAEDAPRGRSYAGSRGGISTEPTATDPLPPDVLGALERAQQAQDALAALPERCRRLLGYLFYEDPAPDYAEISRREGVPIGSLGPTRARCLERMRRYFAERGWTA